MPGARVGVIGLAVMGSNLARNLVRNGFDVAVHDRIPGRGAETARSADSGRIVDCASIDDLVSQTRSPRILILMVPAGEPTDAVLDALVPLLDPGDAVVDAGNSHYGDSERRGSALGAKGIRFIGAGLSGGEEGALTGPSIMAGASPEDWEAVRDVLEAIAARVDGEPCSARVGPVGAGHYVKTVHNGIEYAVLQAIAEVVQLCRTGLGMAPAEVADLVESWNGPDVDSYLLDITARVLRHLDARTGRPLVDVILDEADHKGTGVWAAQSALALGVPAPGVVEAVFARALSSDRPAREAVNGSLGPPRGLDDGGARPSPDDVGKALAAATVVAYAQGFDQILRASDTFDWEVDAAVVARLWRGGCIVRARLLEEIARACSGSPIPTVLAHPPFAEGLAVSEDSWRRCAAWAVGTGIPAPILTSLLASVDALRTERLPAALIQAQRDLFGAHTYRRTDRDGRFHIEWLGDGTETEV